MSSHFKIMNHQLSFCEVFPGHFARVVDLFIVSICIKADPVECAANAFSSKIEIRQISRSGSRCPETCKLIIPRF